MIKIIFGFPKNKELIWYRTVSEKAYYSNHYTQELMGKNLNIH
jgi:hypothetical protein